jgi:hypothetical protein
MSYGTYLSFGLNLNYKTYLHCYFGKLSEAKVNNLLMLSLTNYFGVVDFTFTVFGIGIRLKAGERHGRFLPEMVFAIRRPPLKDGAKLFYWRYSSVAEQKKEQEWGMY